MRPLKTAWKAELLEVGGELRRTPNWNPHVNIVDLQDDCKIVAGLVAKQLQRNSGRMDLRVTCTPCHKKPKGCTAQANFQVKPAASKGTCEGEAASGWMAWLLGGCWNGRGTLRFANGNVYEGDFKNNVREGKGTLRFANGEVYEGDFKNGRREGKGTYRFANGEVYEGDWKNGRTVGKGTDRFANGARALMSRLAKALIP